MGLHGEAEFAARGDEDDLGIAAWRVAKHVGAPGHPGGRRILGPVQRGQRLARQRQHGRLVTQLHNMAVGLHHFVGVARPQHHQPGNGAQRHQLFHRLVGRAVLAVAHGVVREDQERG